MCPACRADRMSPRQSGEGMDIKEISQLVAIVRGARISELAVTSDGSTVRLRKPLSASRPVPAAPAPVAASEPPPEESRRVDAVGPVADGTFINAPMVGIFHSAGNAIAPGVVIKAGQSVGAIESMKLMNDVTSEHDGVIEEVVIEDGLPVEYGQPLFRLQSS